MNSNETSKTPGTPLKSHVTPRKQEQNTPNKQQGTPKAQSKAFEEYWSEQAVKDGLENGSLFEVC